MNRLAAFAVVAVLCGSTSALAEDKNRDSITLLGISREIGTFGLEYEHTFGNTSWFLGGSLANPLNGEPLRTGLDLGLRFYPFAKAPRWFFIGPHLGAEYFNGARDPALDAKTAGFRVGATAGLNLLIGDVLLITGSAGGEYFRDYTVNSDTGEIRTDQFDLRIIYRAGLGFAF